MGADAVTGAPFAKRGGCVRVRVRRRVGAHQGLFSASAPRRRPPVWNAGQPRSNGMSVGGPGVVTVLLTRVVPLKSTVAPPRGPSLKPSNQGGVLEAQLLDQDEAGGVEQAPDLLPPPQQSTHSVGEWIPEHPYNVNVRSRFAVPSSVHRVRTSFAVPD